MRANVTPININVKCFVARTILQERKKGKLIE
jgi:hypothetical protein